ncbi:MAG: DUF423 domain-containing protein [Alphaproteobacteria bacterium]|nr:DUF423 domain-containing protein [Alphaproteobacteria bacterium]MBU6472141.1 DUF423 domain-containing protein [Alphaproteobacteria bacterium]MDE2011898.1 DUF423 domain-containing protein [Alphaproteobacteria bacterium]MDE2074986.1 DUF423 domain-containing protein [Alphaproteobacteria bacterium]MDE2350429.1 DUF423 domain-containing protein [Alphaproteobacteria bacterium]
MRIWLTIAALNGLLAVAAGAFAAHGIKAAVGPQDLQIFETGARYHMYHALALGISALVMRGGAARRARLAAMLFLAGIVLFSGSLYLLALTHVMALAFVTPIGGTAFLAGWLALAFAAAKIDN